MVTPIEAKKAKKWFMLAELPAGVAWAGIGVTYLTGYFLQLKANSFQIGFISAISPLSSITSIFGMYLLNRIASRKIMVLITVYTFYALFSLLGAVPFVFGKSTMSFQVVVSLLLLVTAFVIVRITDMFWYPWASAIVPEGQRGKFFGMIFILHSLAIIPANLLIGKFLDIYNDFFGFFVVFGVCGLMGVAAIFLYLPIIDVKVGREEKQSSIFKQIFVPLKDRNFRMFILFALFNTLAGGLAGPFTSVFMIETLKIKYTYIAAFGVIYSASFMIFMGVWGYIVDKYGNKPVIAMCAVPIIIYMTLWIFNKPDNYALIPIIQFLSGISVAGGVVVVNNILLGVSTPENKGSYMAVFQIVVGIAGALAPLAGSVIVEVFKNFNGEFLGYPVCNYQILFGITAMLSILPLIFVIKVNEPKSKPVMYVFRNIMLYNPIKLAVNLFFYHTSSSEKDKISATAGLGDTGSPMALSELIISLDDPSYFVRREAALALGRIRDRDAVMPLIEKLSDEFANIQQESAWALGNIKDEKSIPPLIEGLKSADKRLRGYSAIALGEIGDSSAIEPLLSMLDNSNDVFETTCAANALSKLGYKKALWKTLEKLVASDKPVVRRQLSVSVGDLLGAPGGFYKLLANEEKVYGEEVNKIVTGVIKLINKRWKGKLGGDSADGAIRGFRRISDLYVNGQYADSLKEVVGITEDLFGRGIHKYNYTQEIGRKFIKELLSQNEKQGSKIYWEECLLSIYELGMIFGETEL